MSAAGQQVNLLRSSFPIPLVAISDSWGPGVSCPVGNGDRTPMSRVLARPPTADRRHRYRKSVILGSQSRESRYLPMRPGLTGIFRVRKQPSPSAGASTTGHRSRRRTASPPQDCPPMPLFAEAEKLTPEQEVGGRSCRSSALPPEQVAALPTEQLQQAAPGHRTGPVGDRGAVLPLATRHPPRRRSSRRKGSSSSSWSSFMFPLRSEKRCLIRTMEN